jgi:hypothetical protein
MRVFLTSPWIPAEWVRAHGLEARGIWYEQSFRQTVPALAAGTCVLAENAVQLAEGLTDAAVVFSTACDQMRRAFDAATVGGPFGSFLFNLPATDTAAARRIYRAEVERLGRHLVTLGGSAPGPEALRREMETAAQTRRSLREAAGSADARSLAGALAVLQDSGRLQGPAAAEPGGRVPLALAGGPLSTADWNLFEAVETAGGRVVLNATETGERTLGPDFEGGADPFAALVDGYFDAITDVFQRPNTRLYAWLKPRLAARRVRGIVLWCFTGCDLWRAEAQSMRETFQLPVLLLEAGDAADISPRDTNRLQAFVETLS